MSGGITQLVAIGAQDAFLTGDPQVSFFNSVYKRHTNFAQVTQRQVIQGNPSDNGTSVVRFERKGDLLSYVYVVNKSSGTIQAWNANMIDKVELLIGGQVIDTQEYAFSKTIWPKVGSVGDHFTKSLSSGADGSADQYFYPLHFFFCDNYSQALPLVALQYHDVEIRITWGSAGGTGDFECFANYVYLDEAERMAVAEKPRDMLVTQVQKTVASGLGVQDLVLNHPVKFIAAADANPTSGTALSSSLRFQVNGVDIGDPKEITPHFNDVPAYYHEFNGTDIHATGAGARGLFVIPFALMTTKYQPCGTLNFSRIDSARISSTVGGITFDETLYAVNYNVLRIENGLGGLLFAN
jgi:hypothetical protein